MEYNITLKTLETVRKSRTIKSHDHKLPEAPLRQFRQASTGLRFATEKCGGEPKRATCNKRSKGGLTFLIGPLGEAFLPNFRLSIWF
jgi:hypothetical protein